MISVEEARGYYPEGDPVHGFDHVLRVLRLVERIGAAEGADLEVLRAAALLHDVARADELTTGRCHAQAGAERAREILAGQPKAAAVVEAIRTHRFRDNNRPTTLEGQILYDADKLDAIGAVGVARAYAMGGQRGQALWAPVTAAFAQRERAAGLADLSREGHTPVHEYVFKLSKLRDTLFTATAKALADERHRFMAEYYARLEAEVKGEL